MALDSAPWMIKAMPVHVREKAVRYAKMAGVTMAEWMGRAVETQATLQDGNRVIPPSKPEQTRQASGLDLGDVAAALQAMAAAQAAGLPVSKAAVRGVVALIREDVRAARGLPDRQTRPRIGQTSISMALPGSDSAGSMPADES
jgi:hypothetical protein